MLSSTVPRGCPSPKHRELIYPLDYGYLQGTAAMDGEGIVVWLGSRQEKTLDAVVCVVDLAKRETEIKLLMGCMEEEKKAVYRFHNQIGRLHLFRGDLLQDPGKGPLPSDTDLLPVRVAGKHSGAHNEGSPALAEQLGYVFDRTYTAYEMIITA